MITSPIHAGELAVMHEGYRLPSFEMRSLLDAARDGVVFSQDVLRGHASSSQQLIAVVRFEDGRLFIRDGLHRATAIMLMRPSGAIEPEEFSLECMTYDMFCRPAVSIGFYAPFDPRAEVRAADWSGFRASVQGRIASSADPVEYILASRSLYVRRRFPYHDSLSEFFDYHRSQYGGLLE